MQSEATAKLDCASKYALAMASAAVLSLEFAIGGSVHAQTNDGNAAGSINLGARGGVVADAPARTDPPQDRAASPFEFSARGGFATDYIYRGTTLSDHRPAAVAAFEATAFGLSERTSLADPVPQPPTQRTIRFSVVSFLRNLPGYSC